MIPCRTTLCKKYLNKLNPTGDWVPYKADDKDREDDNDFWDGNTPVKHSYKHGSDKYGHLTLAKKLKDRLEGERRPRMIVTEGGRRGMPIIKKDRKYIPRF